MPIQPNKNNIIHHSGEFENQVICPRCLMTTCVADLTEKWGKIECPYCHNDFAVRQFKIVRCECAPLASPSADDESIAAAGADLFGDGE